MNIKTGDIVYVKMKIRSLSEGPHPTLWMDPVIYPYGDALFVPNGTIVPVAQIEKLQAERDELREALEPVLMHYCDYLNNDEDGDPNTNRHVARARAALNPPD